ncbi:MAG: MFS transporter [Bowdeniella nasicola]|nr:MFS transporter [Bowdeniella nasicola]
MSRPHPDRASQPADPAHEVSAAAAPTHVTPPAIPAELWVMVGAAFVIAIGFGLIAPVLPQFARSFDVSVTLTTVVVSAFAMTRLAFAPAGGALVNRFGERPIYVIGVIIVAVSTLMVATADAYWQLLVYRAFGGIGSVMFTVSAAGLIVRLAPPSMRGRISSYYGGAFLIGNVVGPLVGGVLAEIGLWVPFVAYGIALLIAAAIVGIFLTGTTLRRDPGTPEAVAMTVREAYRDSAYRSVLRSGFANGWTNLGVRVGILPLFAASIATQSWVAGAALTAFALGNASILPLSGRLADRIGRKRPMMLGLAIAGALTAVLGFAGNVPLLLALCALAGLGSGLFNPAAQATLADVIGPERAGGKVLASYQMMQDLGSIIGPVLVGLLVDATGYSWGFLLSGSMLIIACLGWIPARESAPLIAARGDGE